MKDQPVSRFPLIWWAASIRQTSLSKELNLSEVHLCTRMPEAGAIRAHKLRAEVASHLVLRLTPLSRGFGPFESDVQIASSPRGLWFSLHDCCESGSRNSRKTFLGFLHRHSRDSLGVRVFS